MANLFPKTIILLTIAFLQFLKKFESKQFFYSGQYLTVWQLSFQTKQFFYSGQNFFFFLW